MICYSPVLWARSPLVDFSAAQLHLNQLLPKPGKATSVFFSPLYDLPEDKNVNVIWKPPISELNGWSEQPSEIASSYVVNGTLKRTMRPSRPDTGSGLDGILRHAIEYEITVTSLTRLVLACVANDRASSWDFPMSYDDATTPPTASIIWGKVGTCGMAVVDGFTYLYATCGEACLELLLRPTQGDLVACYHSLLFVDSSLLLGGGESVMGRKTLSDSERQAVQMAINNAYSLKDGFASYLTAA